MSRTAGSQSLPRYSIESVDNAMRIMLLVSEREVVRVVDCSRELGIARSTAHRLLMTMTNRGFLQQERRSRAYRAGPALMEFGFLTANVDRLRQRARGPLRALMQSVNETVNLMVLEKDGVRFIESIECERSVRVSMRTGTLLPAHTTAGGKVLLAELDPATVDAHLSGSLSRLTASTITSKVAFREELEDIRRQGYAINRSESLDDLRAIAVRVAGSANQPEAAVAISVPANRGAGSLLRGYLPALREAARQLESSE